MTANDDPSTWYDGVKFNWRDSPLRRRLVASPSTIYYCGHSDDVFVPRYGLSDAFLSIAVLPGQVPIEPLCLGDYPAYVERILAFGDAVHRYAVGGDVDVYDGPRPNMDIDIDANVSGLQTVEVLSSSDDGIDEDLLLFPIVDP